MTNYKCSINDYSAEIDAQSPSEAARKCVEKRMREFSWFANQSPELASVVVDGVTFEPKSVSDSANTWDFRYELSHELCHFEFAGSVVEPPPKREYQPKTGVKCGCRPGKQRDNCPNCEGTGQVIDFAAIRAR